MKKKLLKIVLLVVIVVTAGVNYFHVQEGKALSEMVLANVDALANGENDRCDVKDCKKVRSDTCWYYVIDASGNITESGEKRPYAYDPYGLM